MDTWEALALPGAVIVAALVSSVMAAVAGFGGAAILLPILVWALGVREAIPILTMVQLIGNASRAWFNRRELVFPVVGWFALGAVPLSTLGAVLFATAPVSLLKSLLGVFLLLTVAYRHTHFGRTVKMPLRGFLGVGAVLGFLSGLLGTIGPMMTPFFLAYGLVKGAFIGTEALATVMMHIPKLVTYERYALLSLQSAAVGLAIGMVMILGSYIGKRILDRVPERVFGFIVETVLVVSGLQFLLLG